SRYVIWGGVVFTVIGILVLSFLSPDILDSRWGHFVLIVPLVVMIMIANFWIWNAPFRALKDRPTSGDGFSRVEARNYFLTKTSYLQFFGFLALFLIFLFKQSQAENLFIGWGRLWLLFAAVLIVLVLWRVYQKWQIERANK